jgi:hypothetical protein
MNSTGFRAIDSGHHAGPNAWRADAADYKGTELTSAVFMEFVPVGEDATLTT